MATVNKSDRKKLISTQVVGSKLVWHRVETGEEMCRLDICALTPNIVSQLLVYGAKQIAADVVAAADGENKFAGIRAAVAALGAGQWPRRPSAPTSMEAAISALIVNMGISREKAREMLGLPQE